MYIIGNLSLILGIVLSAYTLAATIAGVRKGSAQWLESARGGIIGTFIAALTASALLLYFLGTGHFEFTYVASYTNRTLPLIYKLSAFWAGNAGSLLFWTLLLSIYTAIIGFAKKTAYTPYTLAVLSLNLLFFFTVMITLVNPFELSDTIPADGNGLNPMLQNPGMVIHPVTLYLGYVGLAVPFAFAMASLMLKNMDSDWLRLTRKWTLTAWMFLTAGNLIGAWWAYVELGWGGYWAWDPVENASFMPWLTVSALLHSVMIQERKNMLRKWNLFLVILSYGLTLFGTFLVRSGILTSVHAFADSGLGTYFFIFLAFMALFAAYLVVSRYGLIRSKSVPVSAYFSKESSFLLNNYILLAAAFAVFWGTVFPLISETLTGTKINTGAPYFNKVMAPILLALILLMAVCPVIPWQKASLARSLKQVRWPLALSALFAAFLAGSGVEGTFAIIGISACIFMLATHTAEIARAVQARKKATAENTVIATVKLFAKNKRRYGGYLVHLGIGVLAVGIISSQAYPLEIIKTIEKGESFSIGGYELTFNSFNKVKQGDRDVIFAEMGVMYNGRKLAPVLPEKIYYDNWSEPSTEVAVKSRWNEDLYVVLSSWETKNKITVLARVNPFISWIWTGGYIMLAGILIALSGKRRTNGKSVVQVVTEGEAVR
ncbi:heme lyase CcmF/NrfE family subunit [Neobacillus notoginsengisoli]|uniref:Heme lyase CcmF/NrfE family subunit n=1 Tax=Neobacillus notoginsengisoli TaxID=1578198 RepID=A0A417YUE7_9BACI|nr:heme lyase CcmF/NrfE family subunit [Neobacillus notoginsengisoli]RHW40814.1 heme lyase CcmF/NrfE family subunit [Neobacillus notoginsengisoli]